MILVSTFYANNDLRNFSYLITDDKTTDTWAIDPYDAKPLIKHIKSHGLCLKGILNTHQHFDHIRGNDELVEVFGKNIIELKSSEKLILSDGHEICFLKTPGHTLDHQVFIWKNNGHPVALFSGDTLFNAGVGNCKGGGDVDLLYESTVALIESLSPETLVYPGHDYIQKNLEFAKNWEPENPAIAKRLKEIENVPAERRKVYTLKEEQEVNPFLRLGDKSFERDLFHKLRSLRDQW